MASATPIRRSAIRSRTRSSQAKSYVPGAGSSSAQAKTPTVTMVIPARVISSASATRTSSGHCSGL